MNVKNLFEYLFILFYWNSNSYVYYKQNLYFASRPVRNIKLKWIIGKSLSPLNKFHTLILHFCFYLNGHFFISYMKTIFLTNFRLRFWSFGRLAKYVIKDSCYCKVWSLLMIFLAYFFSLYNYYFRHFGFWDILVNE